MVQHHGGSEIDLLRVVTSSMSKRMLMFITIQKHNKGSFPVSTTSHLLAAPVCSKEMQLQPQDCLTQASIGHILFCFLKFNGYMLSSICQKCCSLYTYIMAWPHTWRNTHDRFFICLSYPDCMLSKIQDAHLSLSACCPGSAMLPFVSGTCYGLLDSAPSTWGYWILC